MTNTVWWKMMLPDNDCWLTMLVSWQLVWPSVWWQTYMCFCLVTNVQCYCHMTTIVSWQRVYADHHSQLTWVTSFCLVTNDQVLLSGDTRPLVHVTWQLLPRDKARGALSDGKRSVLVFLVTKRLVALCQMTCYFNVSLCLVTVHVECQWR